MRLEPQVGDYRVTRQIPLVRLERFCRLLQESLAVSYSEPNVSRIWRLYISAECPECRIWISGDELHALALPPCAELASAKIGRMRLGDCARRGCNAWHYSVHFWNQEGIDWQRVLETAEGLASTRAPTPRSAAWFPWQKLLKQYAPKVGASAGVVLLMLLAWQLYFGGRIPFLREPEKFRMDSVPADPSWPASLGSPE